MKERIEFVQGDFMKVFNVLERSSILFQEGIYGFGGNEHFPGFVSRFPIAWQALSSHERDVLIKTAEWNVKEIAGFPGFRRAHHAHTLALAKLFKPKSQTEVFGGDGRIGVEEFYHSGHKLRSICPNLMSADGSETLLVEIDWGDFTNEQLVKEFAQWLKENNPPGIKRPDGRGHNKVIDSRANLTRLAVMRLLSRFALKDILGTRRERPITECQAIHKTKQFSSSKWGDPTKWRDARRDAGRLFHKLFSFLPLGEKPRSWGKTQPGK